MTDNIFIDLDTDTIAPVGSTTLLNILCSRGTWPQGATCASQEGDGEVLYWNAPPDIVIMARLKADNRGMIAQVGFRYQIDSWYASEEPELAIDWNTSVITFDEIKLLLEAMALLKETKNELKKTAFLVGNKIKSSQKKSPTTKNSPKINLDTLKRILD